MQLRTAKCRTVPDSALFDTQTCETLLRSISPSSTNFAQQRDRITLGNLLANVLFSLAWKARDAEWLAVGDAVDFWRESSEFSERSSKQSA
jgi:hypothetical protein